MFSKSKNPMMAGVLVLMACAGSAQSQSAQSTSGPAPGQSRSAAPTAQSQTAVPSDVTIKAKAQVVLLDIIATDKHGNPINDLKREDFTVLEKGKPQQLASFSLVDTASRATAAKAATPTKLPPGVFSNRKDPAAEEPQLTVLLLDALNTPWKDQAYARNQMLSYLRKNHQTGQRMAIFGLANSLIRMQDFTDDPAVLQRVLEKHKGQSSPLLDNPDDPTGQVDTSIMTADAAAAVASFQEQEAAFRMDMRVRMTLDALKAIGRELSGYPGRKKLIWVSGSFPVNLEPGENSGFDSQRDYASDIMVTTSLLRESQVSVYTIDAQGLVGPPLANAEFTGRTSGGRMMTGAQLGAESQRRMNAINSAHDAAQQLADETGGIAFYNRNDLDTAVRKSVADGATYYAVSYSPEDKNWNGQFRKIQVKVDRPGVELRYRKGYFARNPEDVLDESPASIHQDIDLALSSAVTASAITFYGSALPLPAPAKAPENAAKLADLRFLVEPRDIFFQTKDDKRHCDLQFAVASYEGDKLHDALDQHLDCNLKPETYARVAHQGILFQMSVKVPEGKSRIRMVVRDNLSGKMGSLDVPYPNVTPQTKPAQGPAPQKP